MHDGGGAQSQELPVGIDAPRERGGVDAVGGPDRHEPSGEGESRDLAQLILLIPLGGGEAGQCRIGDEEDVSLVLSCFGALVRCDRILHCVGVEVQLGGQELQLVTRRAHQIGPHE